MKKVTIEVSDEDFILFEEGAADLGVTVEGFFESQAKAIAEMARLAKSSFAVGDISRSMMALLPLQVRETMGNALERAKGE